MGDDVEGAEISILTTQADSIFPGLTGRWFIRFENLDAANPIFVGDADVDVSGANKGAELSGGAVGVRGVFNPAGAVVNPENIFARASGGTVLVSALAIRSAD